MPREFWKQRRTLITGATGLMGSWLLKKLVNSGADVVAIVRDRVPRSLAVQEELLAQVTQVYGCVEDFHLMRRVMSEYAIDTVFHLAAQPIVGVAMVDPLTTLDTNIRGTWNVLEASRLCKVKHIVVASSDKAYGVPEQLPYTESHPLKGTFPYDVSKSCADLISSMYAQTYSLPVSIMRCANLFGGGDLNFNRTIPGAILATLKGEPFVIRSDGYYVRDFLYLKDAADAYVLVAESLAQGKARPGDAFNFGMGLRLTVLDLAGLILRTMGRTDLQPVILNEVKSEIREQYLSTEKARQQLGWAPVFSLAAGLAETIEWYREHFQIVRKPLATTAAAGKLQ